MQESKTELSNLQKNYDLQAQNLTTLQSELSALKNTLNDTKSESEEKLSKLQD